MSSRCLQEFGGVGAGKEGFGLGRFRGVGCGGLRFRVLEAKNKHKWVVVLGPQKVSVKRCLFRNHN